MFNKADITRDGTISIAEYMALCEEFGVRLNDNDIEAVKNIADEDGEVFITRLYALTGVHPASLNRRKPCKTKNFNSEK